MDAIEKVRQYTKSTTQRLEAMADALRLVEKNDVRGDVVEVGVWRGGNVMLARILAPFRHCWLFDTFDGMTEPDRILDYKMKIDGKKGYKAIDRYIEKKLGGTKWDACSLSEVLQNFRDVGLDPTERTNFIKGPAEETLLRFLPIQIAVLRLDADWYKPTRVAMERLYPRLATRGFLIVDDYGHWAGAKKAVDDYFAGEPPVHFDVDYSCRVFQKC